MDAEEYTVEAQLDRIESKLDTLISAWQKFEPLAMQAHELMGMKATDKVKTLLMGKRNGTA